MCVLFVYPFLISDIILSYFRSGFEQNKNHITSDYRHDVFNGVLAQY